MKRMTIAAMAVAGTLLLPGVAPSAAADGGGGVSVATADIGIADPDGGHRYYALPDSGETTLLRVDASAGAGEKSLQRLRVDGDFVIPPVAYDGTTSGLSRNGRTLVLAAPWVVPGQEVTRMRLIDTRRMRVAQRIKLQGAYSLDAISPDGARLYLIGYPDPRDPLAYEVRTWDVARGKLLAEPIVDPREPDEDMRGQPMTRAVSPDGSWDLTLYDGAGKQPFVHALNTAEGKAFCIDLEMLKGTNVYRDTLQPAADWSSVSVLNRSGDAVASISTGDWTAAAPADAPAGGGGSFPWWLPALAVAVLAVAVAVARRLHAASHRTGASPEVGSNP